MDEDAAAPGVLIDEVGGGAAVVDAWRGEVEDLEVEVGEGLELRPCVMFGGEIDDGDDAVLDEFIGFGGAGTAGDDEVIGDGRGGGAHANEPVAAREVEAEEVGGEQDTVGGADATVVLAEEGGACEEISAGDGGEGPASPSRGESPRAEGDACADEERGGGCVADGEGDVA